MSENAPLLESVRLRVQRLLWRLPPVQRVDRRLQQAETDMLQGLKQRLDELDSDVSAHWSSQGLPGLLESSLEQNREQALASLASRLLNQLTADEARIFSALADGSSYPLLLLESGGRFAVAGPPLHRHSNVGRAAGINCTAQLPLYLAQLEALGLVCRLPESVALKTDYELCEGDSDYRAALAFYQQGGLKVRCQRQTLKVSHAGQQLWAQLMADGSD